MVIVTGVRFRQTGKMYYFDPNGMEMHAGDGVIVETARGLEYGTCVAGCIEVEEKDVVRPLRKVARVADAEDLRRHQENEAKKGEAMRICREQIRKHHLDMKLIDVEYTFDNNKIIFYFTADGRVDFRELVRDLAGMFRMRIELRQIGVRDEAKMLGGIGCCGRPLCCASWMKDFQPVSIKMTKTQNLSLNPTKISGICGRLMCCLKYENDTYLELRKDLPDVNERVKTEDGIGKVIESNVLTGMIKVRLLTGEKDEKGREKLGADILTFEKTAVERLGKGGRKAAAGAKDAEPKEGRSAGQKEQKEAKEPKEKRPHAERAGEESAAGGEQGEKTGKSGRRRSRGGRGGKRRGNRGEHEGGEAQAQAQPQERQGSRDDRGGQAERPAGAPQDPEPRS